MAPSVQAQDLWGNLSHTNHSGFILSLVNQEWNMVLLKNKGLLRLGFASDPQNQQANQNKLCSFSIRCYPHSKAFQVTSLT